jgi:fatty-acyl-CoA synthase
MNSLFFVGPCLLLGSVQNEKATEATFKGGWLNTGDLAVQHKYGRIQIRDRSKDVIIR